MTDTERLGTAISLAIFFHFLIALYQPPEREPLHILHLETISEDSSLLNAERVNPGTGISTPDNHNSAEAEQRDKRRQALLEYLDEVERAIHARRLSTGRPDLIGTCLCSLTIFPDGKFGNVKVARSSGNPILDHDALQAIQAASGIVKRPQLIGSMPLEISFWVKYQYGLN